jgi:hypothetical protein
MGIQMRVDSAGGQGVEGSRGVVWGHAAFHKGKGAEEVGLAYAPECCKAGICRDSAVGRRAKV